MNLQEKLQKIQHELKAPKNQRNNFGGYNYRSVEDIMQGLKPLLDKYKCTVTLTDEVQLIGERYYIKATATIVDCEDLQSYSVNGLAREDVNKKGMDLSQLTGSCSSYARKYALNGLFCIDDTKDIDSMKPTEEKPTRRVRKPRTATVTDEEVKNSGCPF